MEEISLPAASLSPEASDLPEALQIPTRKVSMGFMLALALANVALFLCYGSIGGLLLPLQISAIDPAHKVADLGIVTSLSVLLALVSNPLAGAFSDRTTSRFGRRRPWIFVGTIASALALFVLLTAQSVPMIFIGWSAFQLFSNFILAALTAIIPDQIPVEQRGTISGLVGLATTAGSVIATIMIGMILRSPVPSYALLIIALLVILIPYAIFLREKALPRNAVARFNLAAFALNFWINPRKHGDFTWAWLTRFIPFFGYFLGTGYLFFYLQDAVHYDKLFPGQTIIQGVSALSLVGTLVALIFTPLGGILSDRLKRRKVFIIIANVIIAASMLVFSLVPSWSILLLNVGLLGAGFGIYSSVDAALITEVLPSANNRGKDMGIINIANTLPQSLAPAVAAFIISASHSYFALFLTGAIIGLLGIFSVLPIKAVR